MRCVIFDLDGTLADTGADLIAAANAAFRHAGLPEPLAHPGDALTAFHGGRAMLRLGHARLGTGAGEDEMNESYRYLLDWYGAHIDVHTSLYPGADEAVARLADLGIATGICTNKPEALAIRLVDRLGLSKAFGSLVGADTLPVRKPDPAPFLEAARRAGGDPARALLVGDTETDVRTARAAGVPVVLVAFGPEGRAIERLAPDAMLGHFDELPDLAERLLGPE